MTTTFALTFVLFVITLPVCQSGPSLIENNRFKCHFCKPPHILINNLRLAASSPRGARNNLSVQVRRLDDILCELGISTVDFLKLDAEGAELSVLYGAIKLLSRNPRPAMLVEVQDIRTKPWGYAAREIPQFLIRMDYQWFSIAAKGALLPIPCNLETYDANLVAFPIELTEEFLSLLGQK